MSTEQETLDRVRSGDISGRAAARQLGRSVAWVTYRTNPESLAKKREYDRQRRRRLYDEMSWFERFEDQLRVRRLLALQAIEKRSRRQAENGG